MKGKQRRTWTRSPQSGCGCSGQRNTTGVFSEVHIVSFIYSTHFWAARSEKQRWRKSWNSPSFIEKTYPSNPRCSHWATHRLPWDKMGPWGDCRAHHSNSWMWMSMAGILWNTVGSWFRQGTYPSSTRRLLRKKTRVQEARSVLASFFPHLTDQAGRMYVLPAAWDSQPRDSGALRPCPATLRVRGPMTHSPAHLEHEGCSLTLRSRSRGGQIQKGTCEWVWRPGKLSSYVMAPLAYLVPSGELETGAPSSRKTPLSISWTSALTSLLPSLLQSLWEDTDCPAGPAHLGSSSVLCAVRNLPTCHQGDSLSARSKYWPACLRFFLRLANTPT